MRSNLNLLTKEEIEELEKFVKSKIIKRNSDIEELFLGLKSGKLKNKKIDVDALDFVYEGLTDVVDEWIQNREKENREEKSKSTTQTTTEKIVCAPNTKIGKFLAKYDKKQITLDEGISRLKKNGSLGEVLRVVADVETRKNKFTLGDHDINHTKRVILNAGMIMEMRGELSERERKMILTATELHDTGRIHDWEDKVHGERAVQKLTDELKDFSEEEQEYIKFIITEHCKSARENEISINNLDKSEEEKAKYRKYLSYMKDADKLDRVRFPELSPFMTDSLDPERLDFEESKQLIKFACESLERFDMLFNLEGNKTLANLFERTKVFAKYESGEKLIRSVDKILSENGYPKRSENLRLTKLKPQNTKFIKDGYLYLLRGSRQGQMSGFYTFPYSKEKQNVEQYLQERPDLTADILASQQCMKGKERFISTTTDMTVAAGFTKLDREKNSSGSIYVIKIKPQNAYRVKSPVELASFFGNGLTGDESEYLIPDYIKPEEVAKEFRYNDYRGIFDYLKDEVGLDIVPEDLHINSKSHRHYEFSDEYLERICRNNEATNKNWEGYSESDLGFRILTELANNGKAGTLLDKMMEYLISPDKDEDSGR